MTLPQLDEVIAGWNDRLAAIADNLLELQNEPVFGMLQGNAPGAVRITGLTAARTEPALRTLPTIYVHFSLLRGVIDQAAALRRQLPAIFGADAKLAELHRLLFTRSIALPATDVPLADRTLLGGTHRAECVSPEELLTPMTRAFAAAKDAVLAVSHAWNDLAAELDRIELRMRRLGADADADQLLAEARGRVQADPLGALDYLRTRVEPAIARAEQTLAARAAFEDALRRAHTDLDRFLRLWAEAAQTAHERAQRFTDRGPAPISPAQREALAEWLNRLAAHSTGTPEALTVGLRNWSATCTGYTHACEAVVASYAEARGNRRELCGRLDALKSKARAYGLAETAPLVHVGHDAEQLLGTRPLDLQTAAAAVAGYEQQLSGITRQQGARR